jgi:uncharacterized RmlC-like cupin family protein
MIKTCIGLFAIALLAGPATAQPTQARLSPVDIKALPVVGAITGTSGIKGIETRILFGDPNQSGPYTIALQVPPNTHIAAHTHRDSRSAVVVSGLWHLGYGAVASDSGTKTLAPGSYYVESAADPHFAWTGPEGAVVYISGFGPSDTHYTAK